MASGLSLVRRVDNALFRVQARLDASGDRLLPAIVTGLLYIFFAGLALRRNATFDTGRDLAVYTNAAWAIANGRAGELSLAGDKFLAIGGSVAFVPVAHLTRLVPRVESLLLLQSAALALGALPVWGLARKVARLRVGAAIALLVAYALYPALHTIALADFHPVALALPGLLGAAYYGLDGRTLRYAACAVWAVACRVDLTIAVIVFGLLLVRQGRRRLGLTTVALAAMWLVAAVVLFKAGSAPRAVFHVDAYQSFGSSFGEVLGGILTDPRQVGRQLFGLRSLRLLTFLLLPVAALPFLALRYLLPGLALHAFYMLGSWSDEILRSQHAVAMTAFVFVASVHGFGRVGRESVDRISVPSRLIVGLLLAAGALFALDSSSSPYREPWRSGEGDSVDAARADAVDLVRLLDEEAGATLAVRAPRSVLSRLADRPAIYELIADPVPTVDAVAKDRVRVVVVDRNEVDEWDPRDRWTFGRGLEAARYRKVFDERDIAIYLWAPAIRCASSARVGRAPRCVPIDLGISTEDEVDAASDDG